MRWPCRGDTGKLISPCSDGATCSRSFLRFDHEKRHHDKQQECGDQSIFERHRAYPSRKHSWARRCAAPALAGCAHAVSGHVAAVHIGSFLRRGNPDPRMSLVGHERPRRSKPRVGLCPLRPESGQTGRRLAKSALCRLCCKSRRKEAVELDFETNESVRVRS
jgi:hypothetical protein